MVLPQPKLPPFLTVVEGRKPKNKAHVELRFAKQAIRLSLFGYWPNREFARCDAAVYEIDDGEWKLKWNIPKGTSESDLPW